MASPLEYIEGHALLRLQPIISTSECSPAAGTNAAPEINENFGTSPRRSSRTRCGRSSNSQYTSPRSSGGRSRRDRHTASQPGITLVALFQHRDDIEGARPVLLVTRAEKEHRCLLTEGMEVQLAVEHLLDELVEVDQRGKGLEPASQQDARAKPVPLLVKRVGLRRQVVQAPKHRLAQHPDPKRCFPLVCYRAAGQQTAHRNARK